MRAVVDHHVDRPGVDAQQCVQLTGPNRSIALENLSIPISWHTRRMSGYRNQEPGRNFGATPPPDSLDAESWLLSSAATTGWSWRGCHTRSHPELDRETPQRRWYCV